MTAQHIGNASRDDFAARLDAIVAEADRGRAQRESSLEAGMARRTSAEARFRELLAVLDREVVTPRLDAVVGCLPGARVRRFATPSGLRCTCDVPRSQRLPATATLEIGLGLAGDADIVSLTRRATIIPALFAYERTARHDVSLATLDTAAATTWLEDQLLDFVATYLRVESDERYQRTNRERDPVCGMVLAGTDARHAVLYDHHTYLLCSDECELKFKADPSFYLSGDSRPLEV